MVGSDHLKTADLHGGNVWLDDDQSQHTPMGGQHQREGCEAENWGGGRLHRHADCGVQRRPRHQMTRLRRPRRLEMGRDEGGRGARVSVGGDAGSWGPEAGRTECFLFLYLFPLSCFVCAVGGEKEVREPQFDGREPWVATGGLPVRDRRGYTRGSPPRLVRQCWSGCHGPSGRM